MSNSKNRLQNNHCEPTFWLRPALYPENSCCSLLDLSVRFSSSSSPTEQRLGNSSVSAWLRSSTGALRESKTIYWVLFLDHATAHLVKIHNSPWPLFLAFLDGESRSPKPAGGARASPPSSELFALTSTTTSTFSTLDLDADSSWQL